MTQILNDWFDSLQERLWNSVAWIASPLWRWYFLFGLLFLLCIAIAYFLNFKWVRAALGGIILLAGAFVAGGHVMYREMRGKVKDQKDELKKLQKEQKERKQVERQESGGGLFDIFKVFK